MKNDLLIGYKNIDIYQQDTLVLQNVNLEIGKGEFVYFLGKVGSGKSSLLKSFYAELPVAGDEAIVLNYDMSAIHPSDVPFLRRKIGIVFQDFQLLTDRTVQQNLEFVLQATGWKDKDAIQEQIDSVLIQVGMLNKGYKMPHQLSGGEQQRIVIARALLNTPEIILADEPTGNLDAQTGREVIELLYNIRKSGTTVIMATHNLNWVELYPGRILTFENSKVEEINSLAKVDTVNVQEIVDFDNER
jgi:cell division transport system ATP-binding protein